MSARDAYSHQSEPGQFYPCSSWLQPRSLRTSLMTLPICLGFQARSFMATPATPGALSER